MTRSHVEDILRSVMPAAEDGRADEAWAALSPLVEASTSHVDAAWGLGLALAYPTFAVETRLPLAVDLLDRWPTATPVLVALAEAAETLRPHNYLNDPPPEDPFFHRLVEALQKRVAQATGAPKEARLHEGLATVARVLGRRWDDVAEKGHQQAIALRPKRWRGHYNYALFLKTRGRFEDGLAANRKAAALAEAPVDSIEWNLAICATGAGDGATAHEVWARMGNILERQDNGLPEGGYRSVQVRLAEHPLAERSSDDDHPGREETIWVERLSPCHGRIRSALYYDIGVDYGDLVLFDGAPILHRRWDDRMVPVFPHLVTLKRGGWRIFRFVGTQAHGGQIDALAEMLPDDAVLYVHTEHVQAVGRDFEEPADDHAPRADERTVVRGKLCLSPDLDPLAVLQQLDETTARSNALRVLAPDLHESMGNTERAAAERRQSERLSDD